MKDSGQHNTARSRGKGAKRRPLGGRGTRAGLFGVIVLALALLGSSTASAVAFYINLTVASASVNFNAAANGGVGTALYVQGGVGAGTGQFDPFLTVSSNAGAEKGYNTTAASGEFDTFFGGGRTHPLQAAAIPPVTISGTVYREFSLDANDQGGDDWMSIDALKIFLDNQSDLTGFNTATNTFSSDTGTAATLIYNQGNGIVLMRSQTLTPGSGVSDITVFVPDALFPAECFYGSLTCNKWVYFYTEMGFLDSTADPLGNGVNWNVTAGFEEWRTRLLPVVNVSKTVSLTRTETFDWTLQKQVSIDGGATWQSADTVNLFNGQSQNYLWREIATKSAGVISNPHISGNITITNPTGGAVIATGIDAVINSVSDVLPAGNSPAATVSCPVTFPFTLKAQQTLTCTYSSNLTSTADGTNTASVVLENGADDLTYSGSAAVVWASAVTTEVDNSANISDPNFPAFDKTGIVASGTFTSTTQTYTCGSTTTITNTATLTEGTSGQTHSSTATLTINCFPLTVTKTANPTFTRTFDWTLLKQVSIDGGATWQSANTVNLFNGQSQNYLWREIATKSAPVDSAFMVTGNIVVTNPAPIAAVGVTVTDALSISGAATVTCPGTTIAANSSMTCSYTKTLGAATSQTNTATASLAGQNYTGTAAVTFGAPTTVVDDSANISDPNFPAFDKTGIVASGTFTSTTQTYTCGSTTTITNTATLTEGTSGQTHSSTATLTVNCAGLTVTKTANPTFTRTFDWTLLKQVSIDGGATWQSANTVNLFNGQSQNYLWREIATKSAPVDSAFMVTGTITIHNNATIAATGVAVSDALSISGAATVDCGSGATTVNIPASGTVTCSYTKTLGAATSQTNTATASLAGQNYTGTAAVTFGAPTTVVDDSANISDPNFPAFDKTGIVASGTFTSTTQTYTCGSTTTITNTATLTEGTSGQTHSSTATLTVNCFGLSVSKTAVPTFTRTFTWTIDKSSTDPTTLTLNLGETFTYHYTVTVNATSADSAFLVTGTITITNSAPMAANGVSVSDLLSISGAATVDCDPGPGTSTTVNVPAKVGSVNGSATCTYSKTLGAATSQTNTATASLAGQNYTGSAAVTFGAPTTVTDECITVTDTLQGALGTVCAGVDTLPKTFSYTRTLGPYTSTECGQHLIANTASFISNDTLATGSDSWTITVNVPCPTGCTLTQGYWKTHSIHGPAPKTDPTWTNPSGSVWDTGFNQDSIFYLSGQTYLQVLMTAPKGGNAYYILAHQYIAALLNIRAGAATTPAVVTALNSAQAFFLTYTPTSTLTQAQRQAAISAAGVLDSYNEGLIGPGHCSEDTIASAADHD